MTIRQKLAALIDPAGAAQAKADGAAVSSLSHRLRLAHANEELGNRQLASATSAITANANRVDVLMAALKRAVPYVKEANGQAIDTLKKAKTKAKQTDARFGVKATELDLNAVMDALFPKKFGETKPEAATVNKTAGIELDGIKFGPRSGAAGMTIAKNDSLPAPTVA